MKSNLYLIAILFLTACSSGHEKMLYKQKPAFYSYIIGEVEGSNIKTQHAQDVYITPASCQKIITTLLAYKSLGENYSYETKLYVTKKNHKIHDLIISFAGDPTLKSEDLIKLLTHLEGTHIKGTIILDNSLFKVPPHSPNIMIEDIGTYYAQPVSSMIIDQNLIKIIATPNEIGQAAYIKNDCNYLMSSYIKTDMNPSSIRFLWNEEQIIAKGNINSKDNNLEMLISPQDIDQYILLKMKNILKSLKIKGKLIIVKDESKLPTNLTLLNSIKSQPLKNIITYGLKKSDNLIFDLLYLKIINTHNTSFVTDWSEGDMVIKELIKQYFNINMEDAMFVDGSGLSRYNRVQPKQLFAILKKGYLIQDFVESLPHGGEKGSTLEKRLILSKNIKAKTGNMQGISCLCGYGVGKNTPKVFVITANNFGSPQKDLLNVIDNFIDYYLRD